MLQMKAAIWEWVSAADMGRENRSDRGAFGWNTAPTWLLSCYPVVLAYFGSSNSLGIDNENLLAGGYLVLLGVGWWLIRRRHSKADKRFKDGVKAGSTSLKGWVYLILWVGLWLGGLFLMYG